jgi:hypothetical protein
LAVAIRTDPTRRPFDDWGRIHHNGEVFLTAARMKKHSLRCSIRNLIKIPDKEAPFIPGIVKATRQMTIWVPAVWS